MRKLEPVAPASADQLGQARDGVAHHAHAVGVVLPGVRFDQHRKAIALWKIAGREARRIHGQRKPRGRVIGAGQIGIKVEGLEPNFGEPRNECIAHLSAAHSQGGITLIERLDLQGNVGLEVRAVGDMQVRAHQRIPRVDEAQHGPHFRRVRLHVVAIEVDILRRRPPAGLNRATLIGAIPAPDALVAVRIECGNEEHGNPPQQRVRRGISEQLAQRGEPGILAVAFTGVNAALDHEQGNRLGAQIRRCARAGSGDQQATHDASFRRPAVLERAHRVGPCSRKFTA